MRRAAWWSVWAWLVSGIWAMCALPCWASNDVVIKVAAGSGTTVIMQALDQARSARRHARAGTSVHVVFAPGEYTLSEPIVLTPDDSGGADSPTVLEAEVPGTVVLMGAVRLSPVKRQPGASSKSIGFSLAGVKHLPDEADGGQFYFNERRATLARMPNQGEYWLVQPSSDQQTSKRDFGLGAQQVRLLAQALQGVDDRGILTVMQSWTSSTHRIERVLPASGRVRLESPANWPFLSFGARQRVFLQNVPAAWDAPGEWIRRNRTLDYIPRPGEDATAPGYLAVNSTLLVIKGRRGNAVENIKIRGLKFAYTYQAQIDQDQHDWQGAINVGAAIEVNDARHVTLTDCSVEHVGGYAIWFRGRARDSEVSNCLLQDLGAGGIKIGDVQDSTVESGDGGHIRVLDNVINQDGLDFPGAVAVWIGNSYGNVVQRNVIANTSYTGISVGWQWGYKKSASGENQVRDNVLWNIGQGVMADLAGIYTLGRSPGTVVSGNFVRHVSGFRGYGAGAWGLYNDEGSSDLVLEDNVVVDAEAGAYHLHYGKNNVLRGNFFLAGGDTEVNWTDVRQSGAWLLEDNVLMGWAEREIGVSADNELLRARGNQLGFPDKRERDGRRCSGLCRVNADLELRVGNDLAALDLDGLTPERAKVWRAVMSSAQAQVRLVRQKYADLAFPSPGDARYVLARPAVRAASVDVDFAAFSVGAHPAPFMYSPSARLDLIQVGSSEGQGGRAGNCLRFEDGQPGLANFDPHVAANYVATSGRVTTEFDVWVDGQTNVLHEWRDAAEPYQVGPSLSVTSEAIVVAGRPLTMLKPYNWYRLRVTTILGRGDWDLAVTYPDGHTQIWKGLRSGSTNWRRTAWIGWASMTTYTSRPCLGSVKITND